MAKTVLQTIQNALKSPEAYASGEEKNQLRVAFDVWTSEIYATIFLRGPASRMNARQALNALKKGNYTTAKWRMIEGLREAIKESELTLHASDYSDHIEDVKEFINGAMRALHLAATTKPRANTSPKKSASTSPKKSASTSAKKRASTSAKKRANKSPKKRAKH
jgi:hypothetical protein